MMGPFLQRPEMLATWANRLTDIQLPTMVDGELNYVGPNQATNADAKWAAVDATGMYLIPKGTLLPDNTPMYSAYENDPRVIAYNQFDEPDLGFGGMPTRADLEASASALRASGVQKPFFINYRGESTHNPAWANIELPAGEWLGFDRYYKSGGDLFMMNDRWGWNGWHGPFMTQAGWDAWSVYNGPLDGGVALTHPHRATYGFLASSRVNYRNATTPTPYNTPEELSVQAWDMIFNGVCGVGWFSHLFDFTGQFVTDDDTNPANDAFIRAFAAKIKILEHLPEGNALINTALGGRRPFTRRLCIDTVGGGPFNWEIGDQPHFDTNPPTGLQLPAWFSGMEVVIAGETLWFAVNLNPLLAKTLDDVRWGKTGEVFAAGQVKCWRASNPSVNILA